MTKKQGDGQIVDYSYNELVFSHENEQITDTLKNMDGSLKHSLARTGDMAQVVRP
jgi:hypothetical protein